MYRVVIAALLTVAACAAHATVLDITATGYLSDSHSTNPFFASTFSDSTLQGKTATIEMRIDTSLAGLDILGGAQPGRAVYTGGTAPTLGANWIQTTAITIAGIAFSSLLPGTGNSARSDIVEVWDQSLNGRLDSLTVQDLESSTQTSTLANGTTLTRETHSSVNLGLTSSLIDFVTGLSLNQSFAFSTLPEIALGQIVFSQDLTTCTVNVVGCSKTNVVNLNEDIALQSVKIVSMPEPGTLALFTTLLPLLLSTRRRKTNQ